MPKIREYEAQVSSQFESRERAAMASDFNTGAGLAVIGEGLDSVVEVVQKRAEQDENTRIHVELTKARAEWTDYLREAATAAPAGDATFADSFVERLDGYLSQTGENLAKTRNGKRLFAVAAADLRADLLDRAKVYQAESAGEKAKVDHKTALDKSREALLRDPTQFDSALRGMEAMINDPGGTYSNLPGAAREQLRLEARQSLALSAVQGVIHMNPELAKRQLESGRWGEYLDADNAHALMKEAEMGIRAKELESERAKKKAEEAKDKHYRAVQNEFLIKMERGELTTQMVVESDLPPFGMGSKQQFLELIHRDVVGDVTGKTDPRLFNRLMERVYLPDDNPKKLRDENEVMGYLLNGLDGQGARLLRRAIRDARTPEGKLASEAQAKLLKEVKPRIVEWKLFGTDKEGERQMGLYTEYVASEMQRAMESKENVMELFDPRSKKYLGAPEVVNRFATTPQQRARQQADALRSAAPSKPVPPEKLRKSGESIDAYLKRMKDGK